MTISCRVPLYYELKLLFIVWLINPGTRGAELLYNKYLWKILRTYASQYDPTFKSDNAVRSGQPWTVTCACALCYLMMMMMISVTCPEGHVRLRHGVL